MHTDLVDGSPEEARLLWYTMLVTPCLLLLCARPVAMLNGVGQIFFTRILSAIYFAVQAGGVVAAAMVFNSLLMMALSSMGCSIVYCLVVNRLAVNKLKQHVSFYPKKRVDIRLAFRFVGVAVPLGFVNIGAFLTSAIQVPLIGAILGPSVVAPFFLAQKIGQFLLQAALQFSVPKTIVFSNLIGKNAPQTARKSMLHALKYAAITIPVVQVIFIFIVPFIAPLLLVGNSFPNLFVIGLMGIDYGVLGFTALLAQFVLASGRNPFVITTLMNGLLNVFAMLIFVPRFGMLGIPMASLLAGFLLSYGYAVYCWIQLDYRLKTIS